MRCSRQVLRLSRRGFSSTRPLPSENAIHGGANTTTLKDASKLKEVNSSSPLRGAVPTHSLSVKDLASQAKIAGRGNDFPSLPEIANALLELRQSTYGSRDRGSASYASSSSRDAYTDVVRLKKNFENILGI